jgi:hypothetical protein
MHIKINLLSPKRQTTQPYFATLLPVQLKTVATTTTLANATTTVTAIDSNILKKS